MKNRKMSMPVVLAAACVGFWVLSYSPAAWAQVTADDVICDKCVDTSDINTGAITTNRLKKDAVKTGKIARAAVTTPKIRNGAVTTRKIRNGAVTLPKVATGVLPEIEAERLGGAFPGVGQVSDSTISFTYEPMRLLGTFTKLDTLSDVKVTWTGHGSVTGRFCDFQLRVDGVDDSGRTNLSFGGTGRAVIGEVRGNGPATSGDSFTVVTIFQGISTGLHNIEAYVRGDADNCTLDTGNFGFMVIIEEIFNAVILRPEVASDGLGAWTDDLDAEADVVGGETQ